MPGDHRVSEHYSAMNGRVMGRDSYQHLSENERDTQQRVAAELQPDPDIRNYDLISGRPYPDGRQDGLIGQDGGYFPLGGILSNKPKKPLTPKVSAWWPQMRNELDPGDVRDGSREAKQLYAESKYIRSAHGDKKDFDINGKVTASNWQKDYHLLAPHIEAKTGDNPVQLAKIANEKLPPYQRDYGCGLPGLGGGEPLDRAALEKDPKLFHLKKTEIRARGDYKVGLEEEEGLHSIMAKKRAAAESKPRFGRQRLDFGDSRGLQIAHVEEEYYEDAAQNATADGPQHGSQDHAEGGASQSQQKRTGIKDFYEDWNFNINTQWSGPLRKEETAHAHEQRAIQSKMPTSGQLKRDYHQNGVYDYHGNVPAAIHWNGQEKAQVEAFATRVEERELCARRAYAPENLVLGEGRRANVSPTERGLDVVPGGFLDTGHLGVGEAPFGNQPGRGHDQPVARGMRNVDKMWYDHGTEPGAWMVSAEIQRLNETARDREEATRRAAHAEADAARKKAAAASKSDTKTNMPATAGRTIGGVMHASKEFVDHNQGPPVNFNEGQEEFASRNKIVESREPRMSESAGRASANFNRRHNESNIFLYYGEIDMEDADVDEDECATCHADEEHKDIDEDASSDESFVSAVEDFFGDEESRGDVVPQDDDPGLQREQIANRLLSKLSPCSISLSTSSDGPKSKFPLLVGPSLNEGSASVAESRQKNSARLDASNDYFPDDKKLKMKHSSIDQYADNSYAETEAPLEEDDIASECASSDEEQDWEFTFSFSDTPAPPSQRTTTPILPKILNVAAAATAEAELHLVHDGTMEMMNRSARTTYGSCPEQVGTGVFLFVTDGADEKRYDPNDSKKEGYTKAEFREYYKDFEEEHFEAWWATLKPTEDGEQETEIAMMSNKRASTSGGSRSSQFNSGRKSRRSIEFKEKTEVVFVDDTREPRNMMEQQEEVVETTETSTITTTTSTVSSTRSTSTPSSVVAGKKNDSGAQDESPSATDSSSASATEAKKSGRTWRASANNERGSLRSSQRVATQEKESSNTIEPAGSEGTVSLSDSAHDATSSSSSVTSSSAGRKMTTQPSATIRSASVRSSHVLLQSVLDGEDDYKVDLDADDETDSTAKVNVAGADLDDAQEQSEKRYDPADPDKIAYTKQETRAHYSETAAAEFETWWASLPVEHSSRKSGKKTLTRRDEKRQSLSLDAAASDPAGRSTATGKSMARRDEKRQSLSLAEVTASIDVEDVATDDDESLGASNKKRASSSSSRASVAKRPSSWRASKSAEAASGRATGASAAATQNEEIKSQFARANVNDRLSQVTIDPDATESDQEEDAADASIRDKESALSRANVSDRLSQVTIDPDATESDEEGAAATAEVNASTGGKKSAFARANVNDRLSQVTIDPEASESDEDKGASATPEMNASTGGGKKSAFARANVNDRLSQVTIDPDASESGEEEDEGISPTAEMNASTKGKESAFARANVNDRLSQVTIDPDASETDENGDALATENTQKANERMSQMKRRSNAGGAASRQKSKRQSSASQRTSKRSSTTSGRASVTNEVDDTRQYQTIISEELAAKMLDAKGSRRFSSSEIDREGGEKATALPPGVEAAKSVATDLGIVQENNPDLDLRLTDFTSSQVAPARPPELYASRARGPARERRERARNKNSPIIGQRIVKKGSVDSTGLSAEPAAAKSGDNRQDAVEVDTEDDGSEEGTGLQQANSSKGSTSSLRSMVKAGAAAGHTQSHDPQQHYAGAANYTQWRDAYQKILEYQGSHPPLKILNADAKATLRKKHAAMPHAEFEAFWYRYNALHVHGFLGLDGVSLPAEHLAQDDAGLVEYQALVAASRIDGSAATLEQYLGVPLESVLPTVPHLLDELQHEMLQISAISGGNKSLGHGQLQRGSAISPTGAPIIGNVTRSISALAAGGLDQISEQRRNIDLENGVGAVIGGGGYVHFVAPGNVSSVGGAAEQRWALERGHFSDSPPLAGTLMVPTTPRGGSGSPRPGHGQQGAGKLGGGLTAALSPRPGVGGSSPTTSTTAYVPRSSTATRLSMRGVYETVAGRGGRMLQMELQEAATRAKNLEVKQGSSVRTKKPLSGPFAEVDARLAAEARERTKWKAKAALRAYHVKDPPGVGVPGPGAYAHPEEKISAKRMPAYSFERADMHIHNGRIRSSTRWAQSNKDRAFHPARRLEDSDDRHIGPGAYNIEKFGKLNILDKAVFESPGDALRRAMGLQKRHENDHAARDAASTRLTCPGCLKRFPRTTRGEQFAAHIAACPDLPKFPVMSMSAFQKTLAHLVDQPHADVASLLGLEMTPTPEHLKHSHHAHARKSGRVPHAGIMTEHGEHVVETDGMTRKPRLHRVHIQTDPKDREAEVPLEQTDFVEDIADSAKREHGSGIGRMLKIATAIGGQATAAAPHGHGAAKLHHAHAKSKSKGEKIDVDLLVGGEKHNARLRRSSLATTGLLRPRSALPEQYSPSVDQAKGVLDRNGAEALAREKRMMRQSRASRLHMGTKERRTAAPQAHGFDTFLRGGPSSSPSPASTIRATMDWGTMAARNTQRPIMAAQRTTTAVRNQGSTTSIASTTSIGSTASSAMKARATRLRATAVGAPKKGTTRLESEIGLACRYCQCRLRSEKERTLHERCICIHRPCDCPHMVHGCPVVLPACEIPAHAATCPFKDAVYDPNKALESPGARPSGVVVATLSVTRTTPAAISSPTTTVGQAKNSALLQLPTTKKKAGAFGVKNAASEKKDEDEEESDYEEEDESLGKD